MKYAALMLCMCLAASVESVAEEKAIAIAAPRNEINPWSAAVIYCDAVLGSTLHATAGNRFKETLNASIDTKQTDRLVIELSEQDRTLYIHHRDDFEKGELHWGRMSPLNIVKGSAKNGIIAFCHRQLESRRDLTV